ncbi:MAG: DNA polymerase III subunit delta [Metamycoplasmataceae bacterium]
MFFIYGNEYFYIKKEINKIFKQNNGFKIIKFDEEDSYSEICETILNYSIFEPNKIIVIDNFFLLKKEQKEKAEAFIKILKNETSNQIIIFTIYNETKIELKTSFAKFLIKNAKVIEVKKNEDKNLPYIIEDIVKSKGGIISKINAIYLSTKMPNDLMLIINEIDKLIHNHNEITKENIDESISKYQSKNVFEFINALNEKDTYLVFKSYYEKYNNGEPIANFISQVANLLLLSSLIYSYKKNKKSLDEISKDLNIHKFRIENGNKLLTKLGIENIHNLINKLANLDSDIKSGIIDDKIGFEFLLLQYLK